MLLSKQLETTFDLRKWKNNFRGISTIPFVTQMSRQYFDLCPPGASRDPQYGNPSTASDAPMTPIPVAD